MKLFILTRVKFIVEFLKAVSLARFFFMCIIDLLQILIQLLCTCSICKMMLCSTIITEPDRNCLVEFLNHVFTVMSKWFKTKRL